MFFLYISLQIHLRYFSYGILLLSEHSLFLVHVFLNDRFITTFFFTFYSFLLLLAQVAFKTGDYKQQVIFIGGLTDGFLATEYAIYPMLVPILCTFIFSVPLLC